MVSVYVSFSGETGYFWSRSHSVRAIPFSRSQVIVNVASPRKRGSPPAFSDCSGSQNLASPLMTSPFKARKASAPPCAAIACLTRLLAPFCANTGCAWLIAKSSAATIDRAYFIVDPSLNLCHLLYFCPFVPAVRLEELPCWETSPGEV